MNEREIYEKTAAGAEEVRQRVRGLPPRLRTMLIMVDGVRTVGQLDAAAQTLDAPRDYLDLLISQDLIRLRGTLRAQPAPATATGTATGTATATAPAPTAAPLRSELVSKPAPAPEEPPRMPATDGERFRAAQKLMNDCAVDALGLRALFWTLRLEKAATADDLRQLLPDYGKAMAKARGQAAAALLDTRVRSMLG